MALGDAAKEALWLRSLTSQLGIIDQDYPTRILVDNEGSIAIAKHPLLSERSKHIDIRHHFVREKVVNHQLLFSYCPTSDMTADIFTKPLERVKFSRFAYLLGLRDGTICSGGLTTSS